MARKLRFVPRDGMVVVVMRCSEGRALLAPHDELNRRILGILGRALHLFPLLLHVFQFLPNHLHMMMTVADAKRLSDFMGYFTKHVGDAIREIRGVRHVWQSRYWHDCVITDEEAIARFRYIVANGVKEGLVESPEEWPGVTSTRALLAQSDITVRWATAAERRAARARGEPSSAVGTPYTIRLAPLPSLAARGPIRLRSFLFRMCREIEAEGRASRGGTPALGAAGVCGCDPMSTAKLERRERHRPVRVTRARRAWDMCVARVRGDHCAATASRRAGDASAPYPPGTFAPSGQFTSWPAHDDEYALRASAHPSRSGTRSRNHPTRPRRAISPAHSRTSPQRLLR